MNKYRKNMRIAGGFLIACPALGLVSALMTQNVNAVFAWVAALVYAIVIYKMVGVCETWSEICDGYKELADDWKDRYFRLSRHSGRI